MMEPSTIAAALTAGTHATTLVKNLVERIKATGKAEVLGDFIELQAAMMEMQQKQHDLIQELRESERSREELSEKLAFASQLTFKAPFYYAADDSVPFCPQCWENSRKAIHLQGDDLKYQDYVSWTCRNCKSGFDIPRYR